MTWAEVNLSGDPLLVVVLRDKRRHLTGHRVNIDVSVHNDLRAVATSALTRVQSMLGDEPGRAGVLEVVAVELHPGAWPRNAAGLDLLEF